MITIRPTDYIYVTANDYFGQSTEFSGTGFGCVADILQRLPASIGMTTVAIRNATRGLTGRVPVYRAAQA